LLGSRKSTLLMVISRIPLVGGNHGILEISKNFCP